VARHAEIDVIIYSLKRRVFFLDVIVYNILLIFKLDSRPILVFERRDLLFLMLIKLFRKNVIIFRSGSTAELSLKYNKLFLNIPNTIIAVSQIHKREFIKRGYSCESAFPAFCKEPTNCEELSLQLDNTGETKYLFFAGKVCNNKGVLELIEFCIKMKLFLKIAGFMDVNDKNYYNCVLELSSSSEYISFLGHLSEEEVIEEIKCSTAYFSNSSREGFPLTFLYALQNGIPGELKLPFVLLFDDIFELETIDLFEWAGSQNKLEIKESYCSNFSNKIKLQKLQKICQKFQ